MRINPIENDSIGWGDTVNTNFQTLDDAIDTKADATHSHSNYAPTNHTHDEFDDGNITQQIEDIQHAIEQHIANFGTFSFDTQRRLDATERDIVRLNMITAGLIINPEHVSATITATNVVGGVKLFFTTEPLIYAKHWIVNVIKDGTIRFQYDILAAIGIIPNEIFLANDITKNDTIQFACTLSLPLGTKSFTPIEMTYNATNSIIDALTVRLSSMEEDMNTILNITNLAVAITQNENALNELASVLIRSDALARKIANQMDVL